MNDWAGIILAAGPGRRMCSQTPKVLHPVAGRPLVGYVVAAARGAGLGRLVMVVPADGQGLRRLFAGGVTFAVQDVPRGPAHALAQARESATAPHLLVLQGDLPLLQPESLQRLMRRHAETGAVATLLASGGQPDAIAYCFEAAWLWPRLAQLGRLHGDEATLVEALGLTLAGEGVAVVSVDDATEAIDVDDRVRLAEAEAIMRQRICRRLMLAGVTIIDPATTYVDADVTIAADTVVLPNTHIQGHTAVGVDCRIGPNTIVVDSTIGDRCRITASVVEGAVLEEDVDVGPFSHLRPGAHLCAGVHIGNYAEVKKSRLGRGTRMGHFSYVGDAQVGDNVNIGAGTITCNFDGERKNETVIEDGAFIGSDTMLVAPVRVGKGARTGAGAVVTRDVPPESLVMGVPARAPGAEGSPKAEGIEP
ncbi:MAG: bifunctional N-acetylglucosamine-1-phosphate uridyltransferase/glucosamine-1-phosphate acetyltransferase [Dehalococcoidia bacterium]